MKMIPKQMKMRNPSFLTKHIALTAALLFSISLFSQKRVLDHSDYDHWKSLQNQQISDSGHWLSYTINPQKGDGTLFLRKLENEQVFTFERGEKARFSPDQNYFIFQQKPAEEDRRTALKQKKPKEKQPKAVLKIWDLANEKENALGEILDWEMSEKNADWLVYRANITKKKEENGDSETEKTGEGGEDADKKKEKKKKRTVKNAHTLIFHHIPSGDTLHLGNTDRYTLSADGSTVVFTHYNDSTERYSLRCFWAESRKQKTLLEGIYDFAQLSISDDGKYPVALTTQDTVHKENAHFELRIFELNPEKSPLNVFTSKHKEIVNSTEIGEANRRISPYKQPIFTENGQFLFFGVKLERPELVSDTVTLDEDKVHLDIWTPFDPELMTRQHVNRKKWEEKHLMAVYSTVDGEFQLLQEDEASQIRFDRKQNHPYILKATNRGYAEGRIWEFERDWDYTLINLESRTEKEIGTSFRHGAALSPQGKYVYWFDSRSAGWNTFNIATGEKSKVGADIPFSLVDTTSDIPTDFPPHGIAGFTKDDAELWIYDAYDIWQVHPEGKRASVNITKGQGRKDKERLRYLKPHREETYVGEFDDFYLHGFHTIDRSSTLYELKNAENELKSVKKWHASFSAFTRARDKAVYIYRSGDFQHYPELHYFKKNQAEHIILSETNPQQADYYWGTVDFVDYEVEGQNLRGMLYRPEKLATEKAPLLVYFYEKNADNIHRHIIPTPSRSIINFSYYLSRGYAILVPDIVYEKGKPGESAYRCIMTAVDTVLKREKWIDSTRMALNGQSWGGYQSAWLITQTNRFKAAFAGAPVSNMTSAYGGIRWKTGHSRIMQYEEGQSRIGESLWENMAAYLENSPLFYLDKVETPLLIMHNDNDGAVPWYQGIELFMGLIRQGKPAWMLVYNKEEHNLTRWANRVDLSIRVAEFYDHYLLDDDMPEWMERGVPVWRKGKRLSGGDQ